MQAVEWCGGTGLNHTVSQILSLHLKGEVEAGYVVRNCVL